MPLRRYLLLVLVAAVLPLLACAFIAAYVVATRDESNIEQTAVQRNHAVLAAADAKLMGAVGVLQAMVGNGPVELTRLPYLHVKAQAVLSVEPDWANVQLHDASGHPLLNARMDGAAALPDQITERASFERAVQTASPAIGSLYFAPLLGGEPSIAVRLPLLRDGHVAQVLTAVVRPAAFQALLDGQKLPSNWVTGIVGTDGRLIARVPPVAPGTLATAGYRLQVASAPEGWYRGRTLEGTETFTAFSKSSLTGWTIGYSVPTDVLLGSARRFSMSMLVGALLALTVGAVLALLLMRRITSPLTQLADQARSLGSTGEVCPVATSITEISEVSAALVGTAKEVKLHDRSLKHIQAELQRKLEELESVSAMRTRFLAQLGHELRNPLVPLMSGIAMLKAAKDAKPSADALAMMERQVAHLTRLVNDLGDIERVDRGDLEFQRRPIDLRDIVAAAIETCRPAIERRRQSLTSSSSDVPLSLVGDAQRLTQVVWNLLNNASKYTPDGGLIAVSSFREGTDAVVKVQDSGIGFDQAQAEALFEMFYRLLDSRYGNPGGLGIGLSLARALTSAHGGRLDGESEGPGRGATFTLRLPLAAPGVLTSGGFENRRDGTES